MDLGGPTMGTRPRAGLEVLVIDDEPIVGKSLHFALGKIGYLVDVYQDPVEALEPPTKSWRSWGKPGSRNSRR